MRRLAWIGILLLPVCTPAGSDGPTGLDPSDAPRLATVEPSAPTVRVSAGGEIEFHVEATSPRAKALAFTFLVDGEIRTTAGTFVFTPPDAGTYLVTAVVSDGELETVHDWTVTVDPPANVPPSVHLSLEPEAGRAPLVARARVVGSDADGVVVRHRLEIVGPGGILVERPAPIDTVLTLAAGTWQATAIVEDDRGAIAVAGRAIEVAANLPPIARLEVAPRVGPAPLDLLVEGEGSDPDGFLTAYRLDADGDGTWEIEAAGPIRQIVRYRTPGTFRIVLSVLDDAGGEGRDSLEIQVNEPDPPPSPPATPANAAPVAALTLTPREGDAPLDVAARLTATDPDGLVAALRIDSDGDGDADATGPGPVLEAVFRYAEPGAYTVRAEAVDDDGAVGETTATVLVRAAPNEPPTGAVSADVTNGDAPLEVRIVVSGSDPDGRVTRWELDADDGRGFVELGDDRAATVVYGFRREIYRPRIRLTDDDGATAEVAGPEIRVHRPIAGGTATVAGNPRFDATAIAPAVWSDGRDAWRFSVVVRDAKGDPLPGVSVRVVPDRDDLSAPDGTSLGPAVDVRTPPAPTDSEGRSGGALATTLSTRIERTPVIAFQGFAVAFEADAGHGEWRRVARVEGLNANTVVSASASRVVVFPANQAVCPGTSIEIEVRVRSLADAPVPGPVPDRYVELRYTDGTLVGATPRPGWGSWRTDAAGVARFGYVPTRGDQSRLVRAWADGQPIDELGLIALRPPGECGS